jgi:hypothetical protein
MEGKREKGKGKKKREKRRCQFSWLINELVSTSQRMTTVRLCGLPHKNGHFAVIQFILASGREVDTKAKSTFNNKTATEHARAMSTRDKLENESHEDYQRVKQNCSPIADLIDSYEKDPQRVRAQLRQQFGLRGKQTHCVKEIMKFFNITRKSKIASS